MKNLLAEAWTVTNGQLKKKSSSNNERTIPKGYIHQNFVKAGLCLHAEDYKFFHWNVFIKEKSITLNCRVV